MIYSLEQVIKCIVKENPRSFPIANSSQGDESKYRTGNIIQENQIEFITLNGKPLFRKG